MKWSVVALIVVGVLAAMSMAFLVASLRANSRTQSPETLASNEVDLICAAKGLPAMTVVDARSISVKKIPRDQLSDQHMNDPVQVIGKVLRVPMVEGQAFSKDCFATQNSGVNLAAAVPEGMRAVSLSLSDYAALDGLLYPGGVVDVLGSFRFPSDSRRGDETVSITLLRGVQVLAIEDRSVVSGEEGANNAPAASRSSRRKMVTLMVDPKQAELLQLVQEHGTISLSMRNPLDVATVSQTVTSINEISQLLNQKQADTHIIIPAVAVSDPQPAPSKEWEMILMRGGVSEVQKFPMPGSR